MRTSRVGRHVWRRWSACSGGGRGSIFLSHPGAPAPCRANVTTRTTSANDQTVPFARLGPARINMQIRVGYELVYTFPQPTPIILALNIHYSRVSDIVRPDHMISSPPITVVSYRDIFGNWCNRVVAPQGRLRLSADGLVNDTGA